MDGYRLASLNTNRRCITGDTNYLLKELRHAFSKSESIDIIVSFIMESGIRLILDDLKCAAERGARIRILTGRYLNITQPSALYLIRDTLGDSVDLRLYNIYDRSFHPKGYICDYGDDGSIFVGSSNISLSALTYGIEWNYKIDKGENKDDYDYFRDEFNRLFNNQADILDDEKLGLYSKEWKRPDIYDEILSEHGAQRVSESIVPYLQPREAQIEALYQLKKAKRDGLDKGLIVAATGIGKTYIAAFDSKNYERILFVAHREEILIQAEQSFKNVREDLKTGFFTGERKDRNVDALFATIQTIGQSRYLNERYFPRKAFEYIVIDEFHHAVAQSYSELIEYFQPKFLLGLTATPERMDNKDVFALCDYNVMYEVRLYDAINKGWLVPFRYYGIYDSLVDYSNIEYKNGRYNERQLEEALMINRRADLIFKNYKKYSSRRAMGFCASRNHAIYMAKYFSENGVKSCAVISGDQLDYCMDRREAIEKLHRREIDIIFAVDMFNEGVDIPSLELIMFLRPTESHTIFLQQLGRGLRKSRGKEYVIVLDFIGNYKKANFIPFLLSEKSGDYAQRVAQQTLPNEMDYPDGCIVDFDFQLIDLFKEQGRQLKDIKKLIHDEYMRISELVGHRPSRIDMFTYIDEEIYVAMKRRRKVNIFIDYLRFLAEIDELYDDEWQLLDTIAQEFLKTLETTSMTKSYKMPLLLAFYNEGDIKFRLDEDDIYRSFEKFYSMGSNGIDMKKDKSTKNYKNWGKKEYIQLSRRNPQKFLARTHPDFFYQEGEYFCLTHQLKNFKEQDIFVHHFRDVIEYRTRRYYKERFKSNE